MTWSTHQPPRQGEYLVVDAWHKREVATWRLDLGWCVRGKWVGKDGVEAWMELPDVPAFAERERW